MYFGDEPSVKCEIDEELFPLCRLRFCHIFLDLCLAEVLSFRRSHLLTVTLSVCATGVTFRKLSPVIMHSRIFSTFSFIRFGVTGFMLRSLIHFNLSVCMGIDMDLFSFFYMSASSYASIIW